MRFHRKIVAISLAAGVSQAACVDVQTSTPVVVTAPQIRAALPPRANATSVRVRDTCGENVNLALDEELVPSAHDRQSTSVRSLLLACRDPATRCALTDDHATFETKKITTRHEFDGDAASDVVLVGLVAGSVVGLGYCAANCDSGGRTAADVGLIGAAVVGGIAGLMYIATSGLRGD